MKAKRLTVLAHELMLPHVSAGDWAIDATAGNGHDALFLAEQVGPSGKVLIFDVQLSALEATRARLTRAGLQAQAEFHHQGHELLEQVLHDQSPEKIGEIAVMVMNLGYLPGGDHSLITKPETTLRALDASVNVLRQGGWLSVLCYQAHPGGSDEARSCLAWMEHCKLLRNKKLHFTSGGLEYFSMNLEKKSAHNLTPERPFLLTAQKSPDLFDVA